MNEVAKVLNIINISSKYSQAMSNANINLLVSNLVLTSINKYQRYIGQIQDNID